MNSTKKVHLLVDTVKMALIIVVACVLVSGIVFLVSDDPWPAICSFFIGPFTSVRRLGNIIETACPLMFTALAVVVIFRVGQFSMIAEGSFFIGCMGAMVIAIALELPTGVHYAAALLFAGVCGALVALVPALLKVKWGVSELVTSIMFNYVVQFFAVYIVNYHFREVDASSLESMKFQKSSQLPDLIDGTRIHMGVVIALAFCFLVWFLLFRTSYGTKLRIIGDNPVFARYTGLKVTGIMVLAQAIAGAIAGIGGGTELLGMYNRFKWTASPGYGWTGIVVALLARRNPLLVPLAAALIGYLNVGADIMARSSDVGSEMVDIIQGVMMFLIAADALLQAWRQRMIVKVAKAETMEVQS